MIITNKQYNIVIGSYYLQHALSMLLYVLHKRYVRPAG